MPDAVHHPCQQVLGTILLQLSKAKGIERCDGTGTHREDVAVDPAYTGSGTLERLDRGGMIVGLDLEYDTQSVTDVHQPGIFLTGLHQHTPPIPGQGLEPSDGILITAVFTPHTGESAELIEIGGTAEFLADQLELLIGQPQLTGGLDGYFHADGLKGEGKTYPLAGIHSLLTFSGR
jgi:hypothetical protein